MGDKKPQNVMLEVADLHAYYAKSHILQGVSFVMNEGEIVSLLGRNGVGRSTTLRTIIGEVAPFGVIRFKGDNIAGFPPHQIAKLGIGHVPENRDIFPTLTVRQNLILGMKGAKDEGRWRMDDLFALFPNLEARADVPGGALSGGEQQMLTMARTLMGDPDLIMVDEPMEGLAPKMIERLVALLEEIRRRGIAILLVEQKLTTALEISDRVYVMGHGRMVFEGRPDDLRADLEIRREWLEV